MKVIKLILAIMVIILGAIVLINRDLIKINLIPYMLMGISMLYLLDAISFYKESNIIYAIILLFLSITIFIISIIGFMN